MVREEDGFWACEYDGLLGRLPQLIASSRLTFCGMGSCIDARIEMEDAAALLASEIPADARSFIDMLVERAHRGVGGEIRVEWPEGPAWLTDNLPFGSSLGGTGPHAAWVLTAVGAPALVALQDRSADMVRHIPSDILVVAARPCPSARSSRAANRDPRSSSSNTLPGCNSAEPRRLAHPGSSSASRIPIWRMIRISRA